MLSPDNSPTQPAESPDPPRPPQRRGGQFSRGASGNPTGRPRGSRNKSTQLVESLLQGEAEELTRKTIERAKAGDPIALRLCMSRLLPVPKDRPISLELGPVETLPQVSTALSQVAQATGQGRLTPTEGETLTRMLATQSQVAALLELRERFAQLAQDVAALKQAKTSTPRTIDITAELLDGRKLLEAPGDPA